jgi:hypothetical protein
MAIDQEVLKQIDTATSEAESDIEVSSDNGASEGPQPSIGHVATGAIVESPADGYYDGYDPDWRERLGYVAPPHDNKGVSHTSRRQLGTGGGGWWVGFDEIGQRPTRRV